MNEKRLKEILLGEAQRAGICKDGYKRIVYSEIDRIIEFYLECPDWCMARDFPSLDLLRREFPDVQDKGIYVDQTFTGELFSGKQTYIFHNCKGTIKVAMDYDKEIIPMLYFANGCDITVSCEQENNPPIRVPIYETEEWSNVVNFVVMDNCEFKRHAIRLIEK